MNTIINDKKIEYLVEKGYVNKHNNEGVVTYTITPLGQKYLNG